MLKKLFILASLMLAAMFIYAQSLSLSHEGTVLEPNEEITVEGTVSSDEMVVELDVTNTSDNNLSVLVKKVENNIVGGSENTFCWAGLCYAPFVYVSPNAVEIGAGMTHEDDFSGHCNPWNNAGESSISYVFYDENNMNDSVMITIYYSALVTGVGDNFSSGYSLSKPYPNPATDVVKFDYDISGIQAVSVKIYSLIGSLVGEAEVSNSTGTLSFDAGLLEEGFYFYSLFRGSEKMESGKFVVKH